MTSESKGTFRVERWDEETVSEVSTGPTIKRAHVERKYQGEIVGTGIISYIFIYTSNDNADIYGVERFEGFIDGKSGTFIFEHKGTFLNGKADILQTILEKSGTGDLQGIEGSIHFEAGMAEEYPIILKHHLNKNFHLWKKLITKSTP